MRLWHFVEKHQRDWGLCTRLLIYSYNTQKPRVTGLSHFHVVLLRELPSAVKISQLADRSPDRRTSQYTAVPSKEETDTLGSRCGRLLDAISNNTKIYMKTMTEWSELTFTVGDKVFLTWPSLEALVKNDKDTKTVPISTYNKLMPCFMRL